LIFIALERGGDEILFLTQEIGIRGTETSWGDVFYIPPKEIRKTFTKTRIYNKDKIKEFKEDYRKFLLGY